MSSYHAVKIVAKEAVKKDGFVTNAILRMAFTELHELGWHIDYSRPELRDVTSGYYHPWWVSPDGECVRGIKAACTLAVASSLDTTPLPGVIPSSWVPCNIAVRLVQTLQANPQVLEDVRRLLELDMVQVVRDDSEARS